jgi:hypothetical protein
MNLNIDSSQRTIQSNQPNDYTIRLKNPIYDVTEIKLVSARIPTPQLTVNASNNTFSIDGQTVSLPNTNHPNGGSIAFDLQNALEPPVSNVSTVDFDDDTNQFTFSNVGTSNAFTFEFNTGLNGFLDTGSHTTPHQLIGFGSNDVSSNENGVLVSGAVNLAGPNSLVIKVSAGSDEFNQTIFTGTPFYTGHLLLDGTGTLNFNGADDHVIHYFHSGPQKYIQDLRIEFFYMSHGRLIPYDFMNQDHILKFEVYCSTDKLKNLPKVPLFIEPEKPQINIPVPENFYRWRREFGYIGLIVLIGFLILFTMKPVSG